MSQEDSPKEEAVQNQITMFQQAAASCSGAVITSFFVTPLDVVKIRLQAQQKNVSKCFLYCNGLMDHICGCSANSKGKQWYQKQSHFNGTIDAFIKISRNEGLASLWSGLSPTLVLAVPATIVYFVSYEQLKLKIKKSYNGQDENQYYSKQPFWIPLVSGASARIISATIVSPLELIRTKMQSTRLSYFEIGEALKYLVQQDGIKGLWKGVVPTLLRDVPFSAIYWTTYEFIKSLGPHTPTFSYSFMAGAVSGTLSAVVTLPFDVVKTHQQIELGEKFFGDEKKVPQTTSSIIRSLYSQYGYRGLFTGLVPRLVKVAPACAIMIATFENGKVFFNRLGSSNSNKTHSDNVPIKKEVASNKDIIRDLNVQGMSQEVL